MMLLIATSIGVMAVILLTAVGEGARDYITSEFRDLGTNLIIVIPILLFLEPISNFLRKLSVFDRFFRWLFARTRRRSAIVEKYETLGLILFVAIPLPVTGAWTGALAAFLFGISFRNAIVAIAMGVFIAGCIVATLTLMGIIGAIIAGVVLSLLGLSSFWGYLKKA
jgi:uncharacterized membrane protein